MLTDSYAGGVTGGGTTALARGSSTVEWSDRLVFTSVPVGVTPLFLDFYVSVYAQFYQEAYGGTESVASSEAIFGISTQGEAPIEGMTVLRRELSADASKEFAAPLWKVRTRVRVPFAEITAFTLSASALSLASLDGYDASENRDLLTRASASTSVLVGLQRVQLVGLRGGREVRYGINRVPRLRAHFENGLVLSDPAIAPEPGTWALLGTGLLAIGGISLRQRRRTTT